jgi:flagellar protein FlaF
MNTGRYGAGAYQAAANCRGARQQEADVFRRATGALRASLNGRPIDRVRAVADNRRLWLAVSDLMTDPGNSLPKPLRAGMISVSLSVRREMDKPIPNIDFLIGINESITDGLAGS